jgi:trehalose synthase
MSSLTDVAVPALDPERFEGLVGAERFDALVSAAGAVRELLAGSTVWNINSTASGGGVAEMLQVLVGYASGAGISTRWTVIEGDDRFFVVTKRIHHWMHGAGGDHVGLTEGDVAHYEEVLDRNGRQLRERITPGDVVILHDPQTAGLIPKLRDTGAKVVWRCHIGASTTSNRTDEAWSFLRHYLDDADAVVFSRAAYAPTWLPASKVWIIPPSIDPFSPKNQDLDDATVEAILHRIGLTDRAADANRASFTRRDGTTGDVTRRAEIVSSSAPISIDAPLVVQVSRWDPLKDMVGVMQAFAGAADGTDARLALVGPAVDAVGDDPEGAQVLAECKERWQALPARVRDRVLLVTLPMDDVDENAAMVNAIQRHAAVVVQKSLAEGFGLTVAEAMWKRRAVLASRVGGIPDQIAAGTGVLLDDPTDLAAAGIEMTRLVADRDRRTALGAAAHDQVRSLFVGDRHLIRYAQLITQLRHP